MPVGLLGKGGEAGESVAGATSATQKREEEENQEGGVPTMPTNADVDTSKDWYISDEVIAYFTVPALDIQIKRRGILPKGRKAQRYQQLRTCVESKTPITNEPIANMKELGGLPSTARWNILEHTDEVVLDPVNEFAFRAPTLKEADNPTTPKHNYNDKFDSPVFMGKRRAE